MKGLKMYYNNTLYPHNPKDISDDKFLPSRISPRMIQNMELVLNNPGSNGNSAAGISRIIHPLLKHLLLLLVQAYCRWNLSIGRLLFVKS
jgi:hypothetical protein